VTTAAGEEAVTTIGEEAANWRLVSDGGVWGEAGNHRRHPGSFLPTPRGSKSSTPTAVFRQVFFLVTGFHTVKLIPSAESLSDVSTISLVFLILYTTLFIYKLLSTLTF
jgi:hypothetical protein